MSSSCSVSSSARLSVVSNVVHLSELKAEAGEYSNITPGLHLCSDREKDKDEGLPSETEEDRRHQENRAKEIRGEQPMFQLTCCSGRGVLCHVECVSICP